MPFQPFHPRKKVRIYFTTLPHWRQEGCTYFVTYRMADSIPERVLKLWEREKSEWMEMRGLGGMVWQEAFGDLDAKQQREFMKIFNRKLNTYLDEGHGSCALKDSRCARAVLDGWLHFDGQKYELGDLVVMPNHVHLLITPFPGCDLEELLQSRKRQSAREINRILARPGALWQKHSYDHIVRDEVELRAFQKYIAENPTKAGLRTGEFLHRSFEWHSKPNDG